MMLMILPVEAQLADLHLCAHYALKFRLIYQCSLAAIALERAIINWGLIILFVLFCLLFCFFLAIL
jgi:hypothetical protein